MISRYVFRLIGAVTFGALLSGCETPRTRALTHAAAFGKLSTADQRLVLAGGVRDGMTTEVVYIAWGEPTAKDPTGAGKEANERWVYQRQITVKAQMGSFDQWSPGTSVFGLAVPLEANAGFGFGGIGNEGELLYQPHLLIADNTVKEADFVGGKLVHYQMNQGRFTIPR